MKIKVAAIAATALAMLVPAVGLEASNVTGYNRVNIPANADVIVSVPFTQAPTGSFTATGLTGTGVSVADTLVAGDYANQYYVRFTSGAANGLWSTVSNNGVNDFSIADAAVLSQLVGNETFVLYAHQTLDSVFPATLAGRTFEASPGASGTVRKTEVMFVTPAVKINRDPSPVYYYIDWTHPSLGRITGWRLSGGSFLTDVGNTILDPDSYFIIRNNGSNVLVYAPHGTVVAGTISRNIRTEASQHDISVVSGRPVALTLSSLQLEPVFVASPGASGTVRKDELMVFDNTAGVMNQDPSATYYYIDWTHPSLGRITGWRLSGGSFLTDVGADVITPGAAMILRKAAGTPADNWWTQVSPIGQ